SISTTIWRRRPSRTSNGTAAWVIGLAVRTSASVCALMATFSGILRTARLKPGARSANSGEYCGTQSDCFEEPAAGLWAKGFEPGACAPPPNGCGAITVRFDG